MDGPRITPTQICNLGLLPFSLCGELYDALSVITSL